MLIGTSLIFCLSDVLDGTIDYSDVFAIISSNEFDVSNAIQVQEWYESALVQAAISNNPKNRLEYHTEKEVIQLFREMVRQGVILNRPHAYTYHIGTLNLRHDEHWYAMCLMPDNMDENTRYAWDQYKLIEKLTRK